ncbi:MAG: hypothetical protein ACJAUH_000603 [Saprospiraceae bacterium]|jgi:hypothetical protein
MRLFRTSKQRFFGNFLVSFNNFQFPKFISQIYIKNILFLANSKEQNIDFITISSTSYSDVGAFKPTAYQLRSK